jgi:hypothetical protein
MRANILKFTKIALNTFCFIASSLTIAQAQKLSDVQEVSVWASAVKVDGKHNEWENNFKATNKSTNLTYTLANDAKNLYLAIQSKDLTNNNKIMLGGITLTVNPSGKKSDKESFKVIYPVINRQRGPGGGSNRSVTISSSSGGSGAPAGVTMQGGPGGFGRFQDMTPAQRDSLQRAIARTQLASAKEIKIFGFKDIPDSLISIYNEYSIKTIASISDEGIYMYEASIPLALLEMSADNPKEFSYNIKLNGLQINFGGFSGGGRPPGAPTGGGEGAVMVRVEGGGGGMGGGMGGFNFQDLITPTDFWGKYILTKEN